MSDDLVKRWDDYVESMGCVMGEVEHTAQQMRDRIEELEAKLAKAVKKFNEIRQHCDNFGRGVPSIDERIVERCEETAANALAELKGQGEDDE